MKEASYFTKIKELLKLTRILNPKQLKIITEGEEMGLRYDKLYHYIKANEKNLAANNSDLIERTLRVSNSWDELNKGFMFFEVLYSSFTGKMERLTTSLQEKESTPDVNLLDELIEELKQLKTIGETLNKKTDLHFELLNEAERIMRKNIN